MTALLENSITDRTAPGKLIRRQRGRADAILYTARRCGGWLPALHGRSGSVGLTPGRDHNILCSQCAGQPKAWAGAPQDDRDSRLSKRYAKTRGEDKNEHA